ncbi:MAG TPA: DoxX family protein [Flavisolibacter sp.]|nr:DoxX family protein [Flavisolibacter sp.]
MKHSKSTKAVYWFTTAVIFLFEGVVPALTSNTTLAVEGIRHLGYPDYFRTMLTVFKVAGAVVLILPFVKTKIKEWAYAGFTITMLSAFVSHWAVDGLSGQTFFPLVMLAILATSYIFYQKINTVFNQDSATVNTTNHVVPSLS